jgi:hypothetical protein
MYSGVAFASSAIAALHFPIFHFASGTLGVWILPVFRPDDMIRVIP